MYMSIYVVICTRVRVDIWTIQRRVFGITNIIIKEYILRDY